MVIYEGSNELNNLIDLELDADRGLIARLNDGPRNISSLSSHQPIREVKVSGEYLDKQTIVRYNNGTFGMAFDPVSLGPIPERANAILIGEQIEPLGIAPAMFYRIYEADFGDVDLKDLHTADRHSAVVRGTY